ncbi:MAG TPA: cation diffusion facilitator family transporter [Polyangiaceae bacterium]
MNREADHRKVVMAALAANAGIAVAKFIAAWLSSSTTMIAEGVHSVADSANQALLLLGMMLAQRKAPALYPLGRQKERYFWAFMVSLTLFFLGGVFAIYEGIHRLRAGHGEPVSPIAAVLVLGISIALESGSFLVAIREFNRSRGKRSFYQALFGSKDPTIPVVLLEDAGAVVGLTVALVAVVLSWVTGSPVADGVGSIVIGVLLCMIGLLLAGDTKSLLIGESASPEVEQAVLEQAEGTPGVEAVTQLLTMHLGPDSVLLALKVRFRAGMAVGEIETTINALEARIRAARPEMTRIFVEPDGGYDQAKDPERATISP